MKRTFLSVACLTCLALAACGGGDSGKKQMTKREQSGTPKIQNAASEANTRVAEGPDTPKK